MDCAVKTLHHFHVHALVRQEWYIIFQVTIVLTYFFHYPQPVGTRMLPVSIGLQAFKNDLEHILLFAFHFYGTEKKNEHLNERQ